MGKSPGKWIKSLLSGKKSSKLSTSKGGKKFGNEEVLVPPKRQETDSTLEQSMTTQPVTANIEVDESKSEIEREASSIKHDEGIVVPRDLNVEEQGSTLEEAPYDSEKAQLEEAATVIQATFRGYLARRAFLALKGIIRLQALIRGHLVRRQAVASLYCMVGIVKLQAVGRGWKIRQSNIGIEVLERCNAGMPKSNLANSVVNSSAQMAKLSANIFICKLLSSLQTAMPLCLKYESEDPNSLMIWLDRWSKSHFWKPAHQPKKHRDPKSRRKLVNGQLGSSETGRPKHSIQRVPAAKIESASQQAITESEKPKRNLRKAPNNPTDSAQENGPIELEKIKRSLRKVHNPVLETKVQTVSDNEKPSQSLGKGSDASDNVIMEQPKQESEKASYIDGHKFLDQNVSNLSEKMEKDMSFKLSSLPAVDATPENELVNISCGDEAEAMQSMETKQDDKTPLLNGDHQDLSPEEEESVRKETQDTSKKTSAAAKQEHVENDTQKSPSLPSYMQATKSAKAKLKLQGSSPRLGQDGAERSSSTRRHSLPSANSKIISNSPRTPRSTQSGVKGNRNDKQSTKDASGKAEWRR